jgi:hypothetical protein
MKKAKKPRKKTKKRVQPKQVRTRSKAARSPIAEGARLFAVAGRTTKTDSLRCMAQRDRA